MYSRLLTPTEFGYLGYIQAILIFISITNALSLNSFYIRKYYEDPEVDRLTGSAFYFLVVFNLVIIAAEIFILKSVFTWFEIKLPFYPYMLTALIGYFFSSFNLIPLRFLRITSQAKQYVILTSSTIVIDHSLSLFLLYFLNTGLMGKLIGHAAAAAVMALFYYKMISRRMPFGIDWKRIVAGLKFSLPLLPGAFATILLTTSDRIILERFVSMRLVGIYSVSVLLASGGKMLMTAVFFSLEPIIFKMANDADFIERFIEIKKIFILVIGAVIGILVLYPNEIVFLMLTPEYKDTILIIPVIGIATFMMGTNNFYGQLLLIKNRTAMISLITASIAALNIGLNIVFIPRFGVYAAAASTFVCYFIAYFAYIVCAKQMFNNAFCFNQDVILLVGLVVSYLVLFYTMTFSTSMALLLRTCVYLSLLILTCFAFKITPAGLYKKCQWENKSVPVLGR